MYMDIGCIIVDSYLFYTFNYNSISHYFVQIVPVWPQGAVLLPFDSIPFFFSFLKNIYIT